MDLHQARCIFSTSSTDWPVAVIGFVHDSDKRDDVGKRAVGCRADAVRFVFPRGGMAPGNLLLVMHCSKRRLLAAEYSGIRSPSGVRE
jgi:hypothetical protein